MYNGKSISKGDSFMTNPEIRLTKIYLSDGQVYYSQFAMDLILDKQRDLESDNASLKNIVMEMARMVEEYPGFFEVGDNVHSLYMEYSDFINRIKNETPLD